MSADRTAVIPQCGLYRYSLERKVGPASWRLLWIMLNPSTADASIDDPTIRKVMGFTERAGHGVAMVANLFAWRATDPDALRARIENGEPHVGEDNDAAILRAVAAADAVVCAWGRFPWAMSRAREFVAMLEEKAPGIPHACLGTNKDGSPRHPLMVAYAQPLVPFALATGRR